MSGELRQKPRIHEEPVVVDRPRGAARAAAGVHQPRVHCLHVASAVLDEGFRPATTRRCRAPGEHVVAIVGGTTCLSRCGATHVTPASMPRVPSPRSYHGGAEIGEDHARHAPASPRPRSLVPTATSTTDKPSNGSGPVAVTRPPSAGRAGATPLRGQCDHLERVFGCGRRHDDVACTGRLVLEPRRTSSGVPAGAMRSSIAVGFRRRHPRGRSRRRRAVTVPPHRAVHVHEPLEVGEVAPAASAPSWIVCTERA
jgi:hypothetical protein